MDFKAYKMDGLGNDFIIIDARAKKIFLNKKNIALTKKDVKEALQFNKNLISNLGLFQFSVEKAYNVKYLILFSIMIY